MKEELKLKLDIISDVWNHFILKYKFCQKRIKFNEEVKTNYFGDILSYFLDTSDIIFEEKISKNNSNRFSKHISLLQSIYVQQDFIEELLIIFKCKINKGDLKLDETYSINREIRNELVGHPIRRLNGEFISSTLFSYNSKNDYLEYLRYHKDNNYNFEKKAILISDIIYKHYSFLTTYLDEIIKKLKSILKSYKKEIERIENLINQEKDFYCIVQISDAFFESIFEFDYIYDKESIINVYERRNEHKRYQNLIDSFYQDLIDCLAETKEYTSRVFEKSYLKHDLNKTPILDINFSKTNKNEFNSKKIDLSYNLGKLGSNKNPFEFNFHFECLLEMCSENELVIHELKHMKNNINNKIEFYSSYTLVRNELKKNNLI